MRRARPIRRWPRAWPAPTSSTCRAATPTSSRRSTRARPPGRRCAARVDRRRGARRGERRCDGPRAADLDAGRARRRPRPRARAARRAPRGCPIVGATPRGGSAATGRRTWARSGWPERTGVIGRTGRPWRVVGEGEVRWLAPGRDRARRGRSHGETARPATSADAHRPRLAASTRPGRSSTTARSGRARHRSSRSSAAWRDRLERQPVAVPGPRAAGRARRGPGPARRRSSAPIRTGSRSCPTPRPASTPCSARSRFEPGDELLTTTTSTTPTLNTLRAVADPDGATVGWRRSRSRSPTRTRSSTPCSGASRERTRLLVISHVTSPTALVLPDRAPRPRARRARHRHARRRRPRPGHGPARPGRPRGRVLHGQRPQVAVRARRAPASCGSAPTAATPSSRRSPRTAPTTRGRTARASHASSTGSGPVDPTAALSLPAAIDALAALDPAAGPAIMAANHALARSTPGTGSRRRSASRRRPRRRCSARWPPAVPGLRTDADAVALQGASRDGAHRGPARRRPGPGGRDRRRAPTGARPRARVGPALRRARRHRRLVEVLRGVRPSCGLAVDRTNATAA